MTSSKIKGTACSKKTTVCPLLHCGRVCGSYTLGYNCHIPRALLYPWIQAV